MSTENIATTIFIPPLVFALGCMIVFTLWYVFTKRKIPEDVLEYKISRIFLLAIIGILFVLVLAENQYKDIVDDNGDISNWATLVIEIGIGVALGLALLTYTNHQQAKSTETQDQIKELVDQLDEKTRQAVVEGINAYSRSKKINAKIKLTKDSQHIANEGSSKFTMDAVIGDSSEENKTKK